MSITCTKFDPRSADGVSGRCDLVLQLRDGVAIEVKGFSVYASDGVRYVNTPSVGRGSAIANVIRIRDREQRDKFRVAALAAIDAYRANGEIAYGQVAA